MSFKKILISSKDKVFASFKELSVFLDWKRNFTRENAFFHDRKQLYKCFLMHVIDYI